MTFQLQHSVNQIIAQNQNTGHELAIKREDRIHPYISGNKYRKLKYNIAQARLEGKDTLLTFGGAFSNHIAAVAEVGKEFGFHTIGVIRGEELITKVPSNTTLQFAKDCGMTFKFVTRDVFRTKTSEAFLQELQSDYGDVYIIPEGGTNALAIKGCEEILTEADVDYDYICCAVGTGGTLSGLINASKSRQKILGFPALKGDFLSEEISKFAQNSNWELINAYHFGGYAKINTELISFINQFKVDYGIPLDPVYTGKLMFGVMDLMRQDYFPANSKILVIHTGGLQGISGMNAMLKRKKMPLIS